MEDPWGSPWAVADTASPPKIDLPAAPPSVHFPIENNNTTTAVAAAGSSANSPRRGAQSPWGDDYEDDNVWGGWNDGAAGTNSPGWGRSPGLRPVAPSLSSRGASPDPWRHSSEDRRRSSSVNKRSALGDSDRIGDSGISLSPSLVPSRLDRKPSSESGFGAQDIWTSHDLTQAPEAVKPLPLLVRTSADEPVPSESKLRIEVSQDGSSPKTAGPMPPPSKVQELVDHYDDIAKQSVSPVSPSSIEPPLRKVSQKGEPFEDLPVTADSDDGTEADDNRSMHNEAAVASSEHNGIHQDEGATRAVQPEETLESESHFTPASPVEQKPKLPQVDVTVDLSKLEDLFPSTPESSTEPELVPDVIIDDTFTSISERKAWYRLSRKGSKLMHSGDLETYVRMDWTRSTVRQDTLKIVRRWMEEDSMTGRPALGRKAGVIGANVFNWNSSGPAVEIGELLGKKKGHSRQASSGSKASLNSSPRVASFEWASPPTSPATAMPPPSLAGRFKSSMSRSSRPQSLAAPSTTFAKNEPSSPYAETTKPHRPSSLIAPPPELIVQPSISEALSPPQQLNGFGDGALEDEDDDDWGEMVTSPGLDTTQANTAPFFEKHDHRESIKAISPANQSAGFEVQDLHGSPVGPPSPTHKKDALSHQHSADTWNLAGLESPSQNGESPQGNGPSIQAAGLIGIQAEPIVSPASTLPAETQGPAQTTPQPSSFGWFDEPIQPSHRANAKPPLSAGNSFEPAPKSQEPPTPTISSYRAGSESVDEDVVARILRGIPDLSYMLR